MPTDPKINLNFKFRPVVFNNEGLTKLFVRLFTTMSVQLDMVRAEAPKGKPMPAAAKAEPGTTDTGAKAYGEARQKIDIEVNRVVDSMTSQQVLSLAGLGFTNPEDDKKSRADIANAVMSAWDKVGSMYMKNRLIEGDGRRGALYSRLRELDTAITSKGDIAVKPDEG